MSLYPSNVIRNAAFSCVRNTTILMLMLLILIKRFKLFHNQKKRLRETGTAESTFGRSTWRVYRLQNRFSYLHANHCVTGSKLLLLRLVLAELYWPYGSCSLVLLAWSWSDMSWFDFICPLLSLLFCSHLFCSAAVGVALWVLGPWIPFLPSPLLSSPFRPSLPSYPLSLPTLSSIILDSPVLTILCRPVPSSLFRAQESDRSAVEQSHYSFYDASPSLLLWSAQCSSSLHYSPSCCAVRFDSLTSSPFLFSSLHSSPLVLLPTPPTPLLLCFVYVLFMFCSCSGSSCSTGRWRCGHCTVPHVEVDCKAHK